MVETDPFTANVDPDSKLLESGLYRGILSEIDVRDFKDYNDETKVARGADFVFRLPTEGADAQKRIFKFSRNEKSNCYKFLRALFGSEWSKYEKVPNDILWAAVLELKGKWFNILIEEPKEGARFNRVETASLDKTKAPVETVDPATGDYNF